MHRRSEISPVASCLVHEEKLSPFYMFHKLKFIEQCNFVITFILSEKTTAGLEGGGSMVLLTPNYTFYTRQ
jgi:hypothetical protein